MVRDKTHEGRTLMLADGTPALLLLAGACGSAGGWESKDGRKSGVVGAGNDEGGRAVGKDYEKRGGVEKV